MLHARRHAGRREGADQRATSPTSAPRSSSATRITCICGPATSSSRAREGCIGSSDGTGRSSPTAAAIRCSAWRRCARSAKTACGSDRTSTGRCTLLTPEGAADIQARLGSDIAMVLDELVGGPHPARTPRPTRGGAATPWSARHAGRRRARERMQQLRIDPAVGALTRGSPMPGRRSSASSRAAPTDVLRTESVQRTVGIGFEAYAIGGLSVGEPVGPHVRGRRRTPRRQLPADAASLPDGDRACPTTSSSASRAASTCSTACCRRATPGTASC